MAYKEEFLFSFSLTISGALLNAANWSLPGCFKIVCKCILSLADWLTQGQFSAYITIPTLPLGTKKGLSEACKRRQMICARV